MNQLEEAIAHLTELAEAWQRGCISEHDGLGGTRSNRNADVLRKLDRIKADVERVVEALIDGKIGWMDSIDFDDELGCALGGNKVYPDQDDCRQNNPCIAASEKSTYRCEPRRVIVFDADELDAVLAPFTPRRTPETKEEKR